MFTDMFKKMLTVNEGINRSRSEKNAVLLDVRSDLDFSRGHVAGSINIPMYKLERVKNRIPDQNTTIYICGSQSYGPKRAAAELKKMGYKNAIPSGFMEDHHGLLVKGKR